MLVRASEEENVFPQHALPTCDGIAHDRGVSVSDVRPRIHVVDRRGDEERLARFCLSLIHSSSLAPGRCAPRPASRSLTECVSLRRCGGSLRTPEHNLSWCRSDLRPSSVLRPIAFVGIWTDAAGPRVSPRACARLAPWSRQKSS